MQVTEISVDSGPSTATTSRHEGSPRRRVCLVTTEFHGLFKNGGIGTANTGLALALAQADFDVTVAFSDADENGPRVKEGNFTELQKTYSHLGITLDYVPPSRLISRAFDDSRSASYCVYLYLKQHDFDVVYFNDCGGIGFYSLLAKSLGVFPHSPLMYVVMHGPHEWVLDLNLLKYWDRRPVISAFLERGSAAMADALISPSLYLLDWIKARGWEIPAEVMVLQNIVRVPDEVQTSVADCTAVTELVFFGRLEVRKGLEAFCDAIDLLNRSANLTQIRITFMGKFSHVAGLHSGIYVVERARRWRSSLRILARYGQEEALDYLSKSGVLAVIPSVAENSPCVVAECLQLGVPFVATDSGGTAELVAREDRQKCLVAPGAEALAERLARILKSGQGPARLAVSQAETEAKWLQLTASIRAARPAAAFSEPSRNGASETPLVSICLAHSSPSAAVELLLESLRRQDYPLLELILIDDGSVQRRWDSTLARFDAHGHHITVRVCPGTLQDRGSMRNAGAAQAKGEFFLFLEETAVILKPEAVRILVSAAIRTGGGVVTGVPLQLRHTGRPTGEQDGRLGYFPIGACTELGAFENCFGGGAILADRQSFERSGGFATGCDPAIEDWLFLASTALSGIRLSVVPDAVFWYRSKPAVDLNRSSAVDNLRRILDVYERQEIRVVRHMMETMVNVDRANTERLHEVLSGVGGEAREIALRVSSLHEANNADAYRGLIQFLIERRRVREAFDFALYNARWLLSDAVGSAKLAGEKLALDAIRSQALDLWHEVPLTDDARQHAASISALPGEDFVHVSGGVARHSIQTGVVICKAGGVCPPGTRILRAVADTELAGPRLVSLAIAMSTAGARLRVPEQRPVSSGMVWWSGWVPVQESGGKTELSVSLGEPAEDVLDVYFLCEAGVSEMLSEDKVIWESLTATILVNATIDACAGDTNEVATPVSLDVIEQGILLTDNSDFPFPVFAPGKSTLLHPLPGRVSLVRVPGAIPAGSKGFRSDVSVELAESHPVQFGAWIRASSAPVQGEAEFTEEDAFSGWFLVRDKFRRHSLSLNLNKPAGEAMDLYLGTRVAGVPDVHYCHAVWHDMLILE